MGNCKDLRELVATFGLESWRTLLKPKPKFAPLEARAIRAKELGEIWADVHCTWLQLEEDKKSYLASLMNDLDTGELSEAKLDRLARGSKPYRDYIKNLCLAKGEELRAKVRYENARDFFEAGRSLEATQRAEMKLL